MNSLVFREDASQILSFKHMSESVSSGRAIDFSYSYSYMKLHCRQPIRGAVFFHCDLNKMKEKSVFKYNHIRQTGKLTLNKQVDFFHKKIPADKILVAISKRFQR